MILSEVLESAIGSGDDLGSLNLKHLKQLISNILSRMEISDQKAEEVSDSDDKAAENDRLGDLEDKIKQLENALDQMNRPPSPNTVINETQSGESPAKKDWEVTKLKKRVDANEDGIDRLNDFFEELSKRVGKVDEKCESLADKVENEQREQDASIERLDRELESSREKLDKINERLDNDTANERIDQLAEDVENLKSISDNLEKQLEKCVSWDDLNDTFNQELVDTKAEKTYENERSKYPKYFDGLKSITQLREELDRALSQLGETSKGLESVKEKTESSVNQDELNKDLDATNENLEKAEKTAGENSQAIDSLDNQLRELLDRNKQLEQNLAQYKNETDRELERQRTLLEDKTSNSKAADKEALERLQDALAGTEDELSKLHKLIEQLNAEGANKNKELEQLQKLLSELQEQAAMRDFVLRNLDEKADKSDFDGLLSRDDLDETAQAIINQLQDLISKQAQSEADLSNKIATVDDQVAQRTKDADFNPFRDEIEQRLRNLRKKIENAKKEDLDNLTTAAGAAGFRRQLFNCISCDKSLIMRTGEPVLNLPQPSAFPTRVSLRPNMTYELEAARSHERGIPEYGSRKDYSSTTNYAQLVAEKELERRRKAKETKMRQELNPYNFNSGKMPRTAGGAINPQRAAEAYFAAKERDQALYQEANLEGTDGNLYRGRVEKLPDIRSHRVQSSKTRTVPDEVPDDIEQRPNTSSGSDHTPPTDSVDPV